MEVHERVELYLDRDTAGIRCTQNALKISRKFIDKSHQYKHSKDLNEHLVQQQRQKQKQRRRWGRHL